MHDAVRTLAVLLVALAMTAAFAHLLELSNKMKLGREEYFAVQQIYRGWNRLGALLVGALAVCAWLAILDLRTSSLSLDIAATLCLLANLVIFFTATEPANRATQNWTSIPSNWATVRARWEYSHAAEAVLYLLSLAAVTLSVATGP